MRIARKHLGWYTAGLPGDRALRDIVNQATTADVQLAAMEAFFAAQAAVGERLAYRDTMRDDIRDATTSGAPHIERAAARPWAGEALAA